MLGKRVSQRRFSRLVFAAVGAAGAGLWARRPERAEAAYATGAAPDGGDLINTHLTVQGNLAVQGSRVTLPALVGIGMTATDDQLDVNGSVGIRIMPPNDTTPGLVSFDLRSRDSGGATRVWKVFTAAVGGGYGVAPNSYSIWDYPPNSPYGGPRFTILPVPVAGPASFPVMIDGAGRVGIATNTPVARLDVAGDARLAGPLSVNGAVALDASGVATKSYYAP